MPPTIFVRLTFSLIPVQRAYLAEFTVHSAPDTAPGDRLAFCEDAIQLPLEDRDVALVCCDPTRQEWNTVLGPLRNSSAGRGGLWIVDPVSVSGGASVAEAKDVRPQRVELDWPALEQGDVDFHPLGMDIIDTEEGEKRLFVINHQRSSATVEVFHLARSSPSFLPSTFSATHSFTLSHPSFTGAPNSLAAVSPTTFYLSHDHRFNRRTTSPLKKLANFAETVFALPLGRVDLVSFDLVQSAPEITVQPAASSIPFANGVAVSPSGKTLVVASTTSRSALFFDRNTTTGKLGSKPRRQLDLPFLVDNLSVAPRRFFSSAYLPSSSLKQHDELLSIDDASDDPFLLIAAGHPSYPALLSIAHRLSFSFSVSLPLHLFGLGWRQLRAFSFDWQKQRGMSWVVVAKEGEDEVEEEYYAVRGKEEDEGEEEWTNLFQSSGVVRDGGLRHGFGGSTTAVVGWSAPVGETEKKRWMVVTGLYEEGVKLVMQT
ncbi:hypothetical protein JCM1840_001416 [Sporobolomyces johnsonii]